MDDNVIRFSEQELMLLGSFNKQKTQVNFNECVFYLQMAFPLSSEAKVMAICHKLSQNNQISLLVRHENQISLWLEESGEFPDLSDQIVD